MRTLNPQRESSSRTSIALLLFVLVISIEKVRSEEFTYDTESQTNHVLQNLDNVLQSFLTPENIGAGSMHVQALRQKLWRILTSPALNENLILPNYDLLSDGKLLYEQPSYENKRSSLVAPPQTVFERMMSTSPYFKKYMATMVKANAIQSKPSMMGKKSIATLAKNGQLPTLQSPEENSETEQEKRNLESLARLGGIHRYIKKSLESLARHGYITSRPNDENEAYQNGKRNLGSLARNGELLNKNQQDNNYYLSRYNRNIQNLMKTGGLSNGKRNIVSLIRGNNMPYEDNEEHKRNIGTIARDWALPNHGSSWQRNEEQKRNVAALLRQDSYLHSVNRDPAIDAFPTPEADEASQSEIKRNVPSIKTGPFKYGKVFVKRSVNNKAAKPACLPKSARQKRQADEYFSEISNDFPLPDVPKSDAFDYDEFVKALTGDYLSNKKRFLGNIPLSRMTELGKFSLMGQTPPVSNATPTSPTYRRRQYLLSRTIPEETE